MVKGPSRNAQYYFTTEYVMPKYGFRSFNEALDYARELWKKLSDEEKAPWKAKEKQWKAYLNGPAGDKYRKTCSGANMEEERGELDKKAEIEEFARISAIEYVKPNKAEVIEQPFYFMSFEYALQDDYGKYYPREIGLIKYSLKRGVEQFVHYFLKPAEYPLGTKAAAKQWSEKRHKIPYLEFDRATDAYSAVFAHMRGVLLDTNSGEAASASGGYPPIYCMPGDEEMNRKCLNDLFERAHRHESERIKVVASATLLLIQLFGGSEICGEAKAQDILLGSTTVFDYGKGVACDWHYEIECANCALATARKIAFIFSDVLKTTYDLKLTPKHMPTVVPMPTLPPTCKMVRFEDDPPKAGNSEHRVASSVKQSSVDELAVDISQVGIGRGRGSKTTSTSSRLVLPGDEKKPRDSSETLSSKPEPPEAEENWGNAEDEKSELTSSVQSSIASSTVTVQTQPAIFGGASASNGNGTRDKVRGRGRGFSK